MSIMKIVAMRTAARRVLSTPRSFATTPLRADFTREPTQRIGATISHLAETAQYQVADASFKAGVVYTLLGVTVLGGGFLVATAGPEKTVKAGDLL